MFKCIYVFICIAASDDERCVPFRSTSSPIHRFSSIREMDQFVGQLKMRAQLRTKRRRREGRDAVSRIHVVFSRVKFYQRQSNLAANTDGFVVSRFANR